MLVSVIPLFLLIALVLGGIWGGFFTPTEASAFGALGALIIGLSTGMGIKGVKKSFLDVAASTSAILFLLISASMYSRMLTISGILTALSETVLSLEVSPYVILALFMGIITLMGCVLDSSSIILVMVPIVAPIMGIMGFDLIWFGVVFVLFVHLGLLTPPFGMCVFTVKSAIEENIAVETIFKSSSVFLVVMLIHAIICIVFPTLSTWLPGMM
jgi:tripartite ATP-independent transporter DctM subunit